MRRLFKKYNLLLWLGSLLVVGLVTNSAVMLSMARDMLLQQGEHNTLPLIGDNLNSTLQINFAQALALSSPIPNDTYLREWMLGGGQDSQSLIAHLKASKQKDNSIAHFLVSEKNQKYVDSLGTVRSVNQNDYRDAWYVKARESKRPFNITIEPDLGGDNGPVIFVSYRILDSEHQYIGAAGISMALNLFASNQADNDAARSIYFVDQSGKIVLSNTNKAGNIHQKEGLKLIADGLLEDQQHIQSLAYDKAGGHFILNVRYVRDLNWYLIVEDNAKNVTQPAWPLASTNAAIGLVIAVIAMTLAWFSIAHHQSRLRTLASKDIMTGLMNRQSFTNSFQQAVLEMQRLKLPLSFILFDIDYLKKINESHGHATGDQIITDIARLSKRSVRGSDLLCRWGGEQFAILLKRCELEQAYKVAEQLRLNVQNHAFSFDHRGASVTISLGVAELTENETIDELFARVDEAVYLAKSEGRNRAEISYYMNV